MSNTPISKAKVFFELLHAIMSKFPAPEDFDDPDYCEQLAITAMEMASYFVVHGACAHMLEHPDDGSKCARHVVENSRDIFKEMVGESFETLLVALKIENPFNEVPELTVNERTRDAILNMLKQEAESSS